MCIVKLQFSLLASAMLRIHRVQDGLYLDCGVQVHMVYYRVDPNGPGPLLRDPCISGARVPWTFAYDDCGMEIGAVGKFCEGVPYGTHKLSTGNEDTSSSRFYKGKSYLLFARDGQCTMLHYNHSIGMADPYTPMYYVHARYWDGLCSGAYIVKARNTPVLWYAHAQYFQGHVEGLVMNAYPHPRYTDMCNIYIARVFCVERTPPRFRVSIGLQSVLRDVAVSMIDTMCNDRDRFEPMFGNVAMYHTHYDVHGYVQLIVPRDFTTSVMLEAV